MEGIEKWRESVIPMRHCEYTAAALWPAEVLSIGWRLIGGNGGALSRSIHSEITRSITVLSIRRRTWACCCSLVAGQTCALELAEGGCGCHGRLKYREGWFVIKVWELCEDKKSWCLGHKASLKGVM